LEQTVPPGHHKCGTVAGSEDGQFTAAATLVDMEFIGAGKHLYQHPALHFKFLNGNAPQRKSSVTRVVFSRSQAGAIVVDAARDLDIVGSVFHRTYRSAVWVNNNCARDAITLVGNLALETLRHPLSGLEKPFAAFMLEVRLARMTGNIAAGSTDMGFVFEPAHWYCTRGVGDPSGSSHWEGTMWEEDVRPEDQNEAVGCVIGFFMKNPRDHGNRGRFQCARLRGAVAWKNRQIGIFTLENKLSVRLDAIAVSDNHIGVALVFQRAADGYKHRIYAENTVNHCVCGCSASFLFAE
jgi:hypothetical protein